MVFWRIFLFGWVCCLFPASLYAQNLVPNGSFEDYAACPGSFSENQASFRVNSWRSVSTGSPDYFNSCSDGDADVPYNWAGVSEAFDGNGYAGIYTWMDLEKEYREYLHCKLTQQLIRDSLYYIEFRYKLSSYSKYAVDRIGLLISDSLKRYANDRPLDIAPTFTFQKDSALTPETGSWEIARLEYRARGNEQFLTLGNFSNNKATRAYHIRFRPESQPMLAGSAYYYIDDVKVIPRFQSESPQEEIPVFAGEDPELNKVYVLRNIQFEFNSYLLLPVSFVDLDKVADYMLMHPETSVRLTGHTDDVGEYDYNLSLSAHRAMSAAQYLIAKGIAEYRISTNGSGESKPLRAGTTEEDRQQNRRVEIEFY
jgi:OmpA-OmpF porin, OOP family